MSFDGDPTGLNPTPPRKTSQSWLPTSSSNAGGWLTLRRGQQPSSPVPPPVIEKPQEPREDSDLEPDTVYVPQKQPPMPAKVPLPPRAVPEQIEVFSAVYELYNTASRLEAISKLMRLVERESTYAYMIQAEAFRILGYLLCYSNDDSPLLRLLIKVAELPRTIAGMTTAVIAAVHYLPRFGNTPTNIGLAIRLLRKLLLDAENKRVFLHIGGLNALYPLISRGTDDVREPAIFLVGVILGHLQDPGKVHVNQTVAKHTDLVLEIIRAVGSGEVAVQRTACGVLWSLAIQPKENKRLLIELKVLPALCQALHSESDEIVWQAAGALRNLVIDNADAAVQLMSMPDIFPLVLDRLQSVESDAARATLSGLIFSVTFAKNPDLHSLLRDSGCVEILVRCCSQEPYVQNEEMLVTALGALRNMAHLFAENQTAVREAKGLDLCFGLLTHRNAQVREHAISAIWAITLDNTANQQYVTSAGVLDTIVSMLRSTHDMTLVNVLAALKNLANHNDQVQKLLYQKGCIPLVLELLSSKNPSVQDYAAGALLSMCQGNAENTKAALTSGAILALGKVLSSNNRGVLLSAYAALKHLVPADRTYHDSLFHAEASQATLLNLKVLPLVLRAVADPVEQLKINATILLRHLLSNGKSGLATREVGELLSKNLVFENATDLLKETLWTLSVAADFNEAVQNASRDAGSFLVIVKAIGKANPVVQHHACMAIHQLARGNAKNQAAFMALEALPKLLANLISENTDLAKIAARAVAALVEDHSYIWANTAPQNVVVHTPGAIPALVKLLTANDLIANEYAASCVVALTANKNAECQNALRTAGAIGALVDLLKLPNTRDSFVYFAAAALECMMLNNPMNREVAKSAAAIEHLTPLENSPHKMIKAKAASALLLLRGK